MHYCGYFKGRTVLVTGHTGFKGSWLTVMLKSLGANVVGYALDPKDKFDNFNILNLKDLITDIRGDIRNYAKLKSTFDYYHPDVVFHLAAQPLVRTSYELPLETMQVNLMGTVNVLEAFRNSDSTSSLIVITSDKVYENKEWIWSYRESDPLGGYDPYSASKGAMELICASYQRSFFNPDLYKEHKKILATVRAGNVIGGGDWSKDRIIPDTIRALEMEKPVKVRNPNSTRPWQHVMDPLNGYMLLASKMHSDPRKFSGAWNFGPEQVSHVDVKNLVKSVIDNYGNGELEINSLGNTLHESGCLKLDSTKASVYLGWKPRLSIEEAITLTVEWYKNYKGQNISEIVNKQIQEFFSKELEDLK